jgi:co-chaperonin GroES (HSP10)
MLKMLHSRIAVREIKQETVSAGGIFLGDAPADEGFVKEMVFGEILALGPGEIDKKGHCQGMSDLKIGDKIAFSPVLMVRHTVDGEEIIITKLNAVAGVIKTADELEAA